METWLTRWPDANVGIVTGSVSGVVVFDFDSDAAFVDAQERGLGRGIVAKSGRGYHVYYGHPGGRVPSRTRIMADVDVRGDGGYAVAPPSTHANGKAYKWIDDPEGISAAEIPDWLLDELRTVDHAEQQRETPHATEVLDAGKVLQDHADLVRSSVKGGRNHQLNASAFRMGQLVAAGLLDAAEAKDALITAALESGLQAPESAKTFESGFKKGMKNPWVDHSKPKETLSEDHFARVFSERYGDSARYCHTRQRWFLYNGNHWAEDATLQTKDMLRGIVRDLSKGTTQFCKSSVVNGSEKLAQSDLRHAVTSDYWNKDIYRLGTPSGTIDLLTGSLLATSPDDAITKVTACAPAPGEPATWLEFLDQATGHDPEMVRYLKQICGYILTGDTKEHALFFIYGPGGNGKSVFLNTIAGVLGDYAVTASMETFTAQKFTQHPTELAMLFGARLVSASETEANRQLAEARIKQLTGGDPISARFMHQDNFEYTPQFKLVMIGNHEPRIQHIDDAIRRRFNVLPFNHKPIKPDRNLEQKLRNEWPQILNWMIEGCLDWRQNGLVRPDRVRDATEEYLSSQDTFQQWVDQHVKLVPNVYTPVSDAYKSWEQFASDCGEQPENKFAFGRRLKKLGIESKVRADKNGGSVRCYAGMKLVSGPRPD